MRKRSRIALALLLLAVIGGIAWLTLRPNEPMYKGKPLSVWLEGYERSFGGPINDARYAEEANEAVRHIGTNAIPTLLRRLKANDSSLTLRLVALAKKQHVFKVKFKPARMLQIEGICGFQALGAEGKAAVPELIRIYEQDHSHNSRYAVTASLGAIGPSAAEAVPLLVRSLRDTNLWYWNITAHVLGEIHSRPEIAVPALVRCLSDQSEGIRRNAALAIAGFGSDAKQAVPDLLKALADSNVEVQEVAKYALKKIDPQTAFKAGVK